MPRRAHFTVAMSFDGTRQSKVTIEQTDSAVYFTVRPYRRRRRYEMLLSDVAQIVAERVIKTEAAEKRKAKAAKRGRHP